MFLPQRNVESETTTNFTFYQSGVFNRYGLIPRSLLRYSGSHEPLYS